MQVLKMNKHIHNQNNLVGSFHTTGEELVTEEEWETWFSLSRPQKNLYQWYVTGTVECFHQIDTREMKGLEQDENKEKLTDKKYLFEVDVSVAQVGDLSPIAEEEGNGD
ncbi:hypothetical protein HAX54_047910 [Datura stramonium]|uniref:Uncharacterized protein n=1 Tax=Datura stramonium TaxID=4076 RepID=A0ABS8WNG2_DATST|nr:hypothetical protein [Datura stramonium]